MYKSCRILNKITNQISCGQIDTELVSLAEYELVEIPDDGKIYEPIEDPPYYQEKTQSLEEYRQALLETIENLKQTPFPISITDTSSESGSYYLNLQDSTILKLLVLLKKAEIIGQAADEFINANTGISEYKTFTLTAIQGVQAEVIQKDDFLKLKANQVKNALTIEDLQFIELELEEF
ncbi:MAG TPA: hypothetical protein P5556_01660 [Candidatus Gastranaerophilales bacterium]|nr:hypothetical protein [Candidatus Gastranaerophilales bacterium]